MQVVGIRAGNAHLDEIAGLGILSLADMHDAVNFRCIRAGAADGPIIAGFVHQRGKRQAHFAFQTPGADFFLYSHESGAALFPDFVRQRIGQGIGRCAFYRRIGKTTHAIELRFFEKIQQRREFRLGFSWKSGDERAANGESRTDFALGANAFQVVLRARGTLHHFEDARAGVLERNVEIG